MKRWLKTGQLAKGDRGEKSRAGYTITEVMIALAVSALMFVSVSFMLRGKQADAQFTQAVRDLESRIQVAANDVRNGYYNSAFRCTAAGTQPQIDEVGANTPGANKGCVFMGKVMTMTPEGSVHMIKVTTMVGRQYVSGTKAPTSLQEAMSVPVQQTVASFAQSYGMEVIRIRPIGTNENIESFAFMTDLSSAVADRGASVLLYRVSGPLGTPASFQPVPQGIRICVRGSVNKIGEVTVGASGDQTSTNVVIGGGGECSS